jgi:hypothetical protein
MQPERQSPHFSVFQFFTSSNCNDHALPDFTLNQNRPSWRFITIDLVIRRLDVAHKTNPPSRFMSLAEIDHEKPN